MALLFWEGFDSYNTGDNITNFKYNASNGPYPGRNACTINSGVGRFGGGGNISGDITTGWVDFSMFTPSEIYTGRAINVDGYNNFMHTYEQTDNGGSYPTPAVTVQHVGNGQIIIYRGKGIDGYGSDVNKLIIGQTDLGVFKINQWNFVELRVKLSSSATTDDGIVEFWINDQKVISNTACRTKNYTSSYYRGMGIACERYTGYTDDIYVCDTTGPAPWNNRLGDLRIANIDITGDAGPNQGYASVGGLGGHYMAVRSKTVNTANFISTSSLSSSNGEMFSHAGLPTVNGKGILATAVTVYAGKNDAGNAMFKISIATNGNTYNSNTFSLSTTNSYYRQEWVANPSTGSTWSNADWYSSNVGFYIV